MHHPAVLRCSLPFSGSSRLERMISTAFSTSSLLQTLSWMVLSRSLFKLSSSLTPSFPLSWGGERSCFTASRIRTRAKARTWVMVSGGPPRPISPARGSTQPLSSDDISSATEATMRPQGLTCKILSLGRGCKLNTYQGQVCGYHTVRREQTQE